MVSRRLVIAVVVAQLAAFAVFAQESAELGRASGGELLLAPKGSSQFSGSLQLSMASGSGVLGTHNSPGYGGTAGGTLIQDRLWFFATASRQGATATQFALPQNAATSAVGARVDGQLAANHGFSAFFQGARRPELSTVAPPSFTGVTPSSFLSLHYTGIISSNMFFTASAVRSSSTVRGVGIIPEN
jgi:hypothetical protein